MTRIECGFSQFDDIDSTIEHLIARERINEN